MKLLVGLGNPGEKHARHRHNVGYMIADEIARAYGFESWRSRFQGDMAEGRLDGVKCLLLKPTTYMNDSGQSVGEAARYYKIPTEDVIVFHDEIDLQPGKLRVKTGGGVAGHNGLKSVTAHLGNDYVRVRIGVGHPGRKDLVHRHVLHDFASADQAWLEPLMDAIVKDVPLLAADDVPNFMNKIARALQADAADEPATQAAAKKPAAKAGQPSPAADKRDLSEEGPLAAKLKQWLKPKKS